MEQLILPRAIKLLVALCFIGAYIDIAHANIGAIGQVKGSGVLERGAKVVIEGDIGTAVQSMDEAVTANGTMRIDFIDETRVFGNLSASDFILDNSKEDSHGLEHVTLNQTYNGIPVFDGELKFHFNSSKNISAINGNIVEGIKINTTPAISILEAKNMALELINNQNINYSGKELFVKQNDLLVYPRGIVKGQIISNYLAYYIEVRNNLDVISSLQCHASWKWEQITGLCFAH